MANNSFIQNSIGKDWFDQTSSKTFKDTISKTNTCFQQHHDFFKKNFSKKRFRKKWLNIEITPQNKQTLSHL